MWKIFLIFYIGFCISVPFQAEACAFAFSDLMLHFKYKKILGHVGVHTTKDLSELTEQQLMDIFFLQNQRRKRRIVGIIKSYLSSRGESLARDFLEDIGLTIEAVHTLRMKGVRDVESLRILLEREELEQVLLEGYRLGGMRNRWVDVRKIENYLSSRE